MDYKLVIENYSSAAIYTLQNTITFLRPKVFEYQTETELLNGTGT